MIDICIPAGNEAAFLEKAGQLGYQHVVMLYPFKNNTEIQKKKAELKNLKNVFIGTYLHAKTAGEIRKLEKIHRDSDLIAVSCQNEDIVRFASECRFVDVIFEITTASVRDRLDYRISNMNAVIANAMRENKQAYALSFAHLLGSSGKDRAKILGREIQNIQLVRRKTSILFASFARQPEQMRLPENLAAFGRVLGMNYPQSKAATSTAIEQILKRKEHRRSREFVRPGIRIIN